MKHLLVPAFLAFLLSFGVPAARAQFTPEQIAQRDAQEEFLLTADIVRSEPIDEGVTKPFKLYLRKGDVEAKAAWKNPSGVQLGFLEGWQYEIAAYRLDKLIGLNMIPPAVEREFQGKPGALVYWAENKYSLLKIMEQGIRIPDSALDHTEKMKWLTRAWDSLIANEDRTQQNILYTEGWRMIIFDHSRAFRSDGEFAERLMFGRNGIKVSQQGTPFLFHRLPRWFLEKLKTLTFENVKAAVGTTLKDREIKAILARKDILLEEVALMVREQGEAAVLY
ncbi:MAG: hypothetical protein A2Y86_03145 [Candidatus Aminicenantes bacterium RBG_13_62_12]|nr:MAG: hypothetical protein A2Y86_03145 [Candidatus Aminicenantes bacterium RBG_13_62_12]